MLLQAQAWFRRIRVGWRFLSGFLQFFATLATILLFLGIGTGIVSAVKSNWLNALSATSVALMAFVFLFMLRRIIRGSTNARSDLVWEDSHHILRFSDDPEVMIGDTIINIRALRDGVDRVNLKFFWTGTGTSDLKLQSPGHYISGKPVRREVFSYYDVCFGRRLKANEPEEIRIRQTFEDTGRTFEPVLSKTVTEPVEKLLLQVNFEKPPATITRYIHASYFPVDEQYSERLPFTGNVHTWEIKRPKYGNKYTLRWE